MESNRNPHGKHGDTLKVVKKNIDRGTIKLRDFETLELFKKSDYNNDDNCRKNETKLPFNEVLKKARTKRFKKKQLYSTMRSLRKDLLRSFALTWKSGLPEKESAIVYEYALESIFFDQRKSYNDNNVNNVNNNDDDDCADSLSNEDFISFCSELISSFKRENDQQEPNFSLEFIVFCKVVESFSSKIIKRKKETTKFLSKRKILFEFCNHVDFSIKNLIFEKDIDFKKLFTSENQTQSSWSSSYVFSKYGMDIKKNLLIFFEHSLDQMLKKKWYIKCIWRMKNAFNFNENVHYLLLEKAKILALPDHEYFLLNQRKLSIQSNQHPYYNQQSFECSMEFEKWKNYSLTQIDSRMNELSNNNNNNINGNIFKKSALGVLNIRIIALQGFSVFEHIYFEIKFQGIVYRTDLSGTNIENDSIKYFWGPLSTSHSCSFAISDDISNNNNNNNNNNNIKRKDKKGNDQSLEIIMYLLKKNDYKSKENQKNKKKKTKPYAKTVFSDVFSFVQGFDMWVNMKPFFKNGRKKEKKENQAFAGNHPKLHLNCQLLVFPDSRENDFFLPDFHEMYRSLLMKLIDYENRQAYSSDLTMDSSSVSLSSYSKYILKCFSSQYGIMDSFCNLHYLDVLVRFMESRPLGSQIPQVLKSLSEFYDKNKDKNEDYFVSRTCLTVVDSTMLKGIHVSLLSICRNWIPRYFIVFPENKPSGALSDILVLYNIVCESRYIKEADTETEAQARENEVELSEKSVNDLLDLSINMMLDAQMMQINWNVKFPEPLIMLVENMHLNFERDHKYYYSVFKSSSSSVDLLSKEAHHFVNLLSQKVKEVVPLGLKNEYEKIMYGEKFMELYFKLKELMNTIRSVNTSYEILPLCEPFQFIILKWITSTSSKLREWAETVFTGDDWKSSISLDHLHSTSVVDLFSVMLPAVNFFSRLEWGVNEPKNTKNGYFNLISNLALVLCNAIQYFAQRLERLCLDTIHRTKKNMFSLDFDYNGNCKMEDMNKLCIQINTLLAVTMFLNSVETRFEEEISGKKDGQLLLEDASLILSGIFDETFKFVNESVKKVISGIASVEMKRVSFQFIYRIAGFPSSSMKDFMGEDLSVSTGVFMNIKMRRQRKNSSNPAPAPNVESVKSELAPFFEYLNSVLSFLTSNLYYDVFKSLLRQFWESMLQIMEAMVFPKSSEYVLSSVQVEVLKEILHLIALFLQGDNNEGLGKGFLRKGLDIWDEVFRQYAHTNCKELFLSYHASLLSKSHYPTEK